MTPALVLFLLHHIAASKFWQNDVLKRKIKCLVEKQPMGSASWFSEGKGPCEAETSSLVGRPPGTTRDWPSVFGRGRIALGLTPWWGAEVLNTLKCGGGFGNCGNVAHRARGSIAQTCKTGGSWSRSQRRAGGWLRSMSSWATLLGSPAVGIGDLHGGLLHVTQPFSLSASFSPAIVSFWSFSDSSLFLSLTTFSCSWPLVTSLASSNVSEKGTVKRSGCQTHE